MAEDQGTGCPIFIERCVTDEMRRSKKALPLQYTHGSKQAGCDLIIDQVNSLMDEELKVRIAIPLCSL